MKDELPRNIKLPNPWQPPLVTAPHPLCDLCSWSYSDRDKVWSLKFRNAQCWRHKPGIPQEAAETLLSLFDMIQAEELPKRHYGTSCAR